MEEAFFCRNRLLLFPLEKNSPEINKASTGFGAYRVLMRRDRSPMVSKRTRLERVLMRTISEGINPTNRNENGTEIQRVFRLDVYNLRTSGNNKSSSGRFSSVSQSKTRRNIKKRLKIQFLYFTRAMWRITAALGERRLDLSRAKAPLVGFQVGRRKRR